MKKTRVVKGRPKFTETGGGCDDEEARTFFAEVDYMRQRKKKGQGLFWKEIILIQ